MTRTTHAPSPATDAGSLDWSAYFDDLQTGMRFTTPLRVVDERDVQLFAALTGDHHPQHTDAAWAARSPFGERIAHGLLVVSLATGLVPFDPDRVVALRRLTDCVFKRPLRLGAALRVDGAIAGLRPLSGPAGVVELRWQVRDDEGQLCCRATVEVLWARHERDDPCAPCPDGFVPIPL